MAKDIKKDHSIGAGTGAVAGAATGAIVGSAAGPAGTLAGAVAGGVIGAKAGDSIAEAINPTAYTTYFEREYKKAPYYTADRSWTDYEPAYKYGYDTYTEFRGKPFADIEPELERRWAENRASARLPWEEAKQAVRHGWHRIEENLPGDFDRDGR